MSDYIVTRAGQKLEGALKAFAVDLRGKVVLDIGSSTGGFTEMALKKGAKKVVAVEKGTQQMRFDLAMDRKVELHEKTDIFDFKMQKKPDVILIDVSFVSLRDILAHVKRKLAGADTAILAMLKPQFEMSDEVLNRGVMKNSRVRREAIKAFEVWLKSNGFVVLDKRDNEVVGRFGNQERFYYLKISRP